MEKKKALLLLTGGRSVPDMLVIKHLRPDIAFNITTAQGLKDAKNLKDFSSSHFQCDIEVLLTIDPFNEQQIKERCMEALLREPDAEWIMHFTGSPKVVGIYAHDIARERGIPLLFLDTAGEQVVSLIKAYELDTGELFKATVEEYVGAYGRTYEIPKSLSYREKAESWYPIAKVLALAPEASQLLLTALRKAQDDKTPLTPNVNVQAEQLLEQLSDLGMLTMIGKTADMLQCTIKDHEGFEFLMGDWLEVYVWHEATNAGFADDCQWGYKIVVDQKIAAILPSNELDLALTYKARLLIAECKTSRDPFDPKFLDKLYSIANLVGGGYVRQVFVTNCPYPQKKNERFDNFSRQAEVRRISIVTGDQLFRVGTLLRQEIGADSPKVLPTYGSH